MFILINMKEHYNILIKKTRDSKKSNRQYLPLTKEWNNSFYNFNKNKIAKTLVIKNKYVYKLFFSYFNIKKIKVLKKKKRKFSIIKVYISRQDIKHANNIVYITLCIFNKEKVSLKKYVKKLYIKTFNIYKKSSYFFKGKTLYIRNIYNTKKKFNILNCKFFFNKTRFTKLKKKTDINLFLKYKKYYILCIRYYLRKFKKLLRFKIKIIKLRFINYKYNITNFLGIKNILYKIYSKKIEFNIINLKYLYLDGNILTESLGAKLKDRKAHLLINIIKSIACVKIPYLDDYYFIEHYKLNNKLIYQGLPSIKDLVTIKDSIYFSLQKLSVVLYNLKYKTIKGVRVQASGRLTKRLTALRSVSKFRQKGNLKNIYSSYHKISTVMLLGYIRSNIQYIKKNYNNRNGSYGIKTHISSF